jgi:hypothetical protein
MGVGKEMAPRVREHPGTRPTENNRAEEATVDKKSLAHPAHPSTADQEHEGSEELRRSCFYCLEGWVFLGSLDHDGGEIVEAIRCRRCDATGRTNR